MPVADELLCFRRSPPGNQFTVSRADSIKEWKHKPRTEKHGGKACQCREADSAAQPVTMPPGFIYQADAGGVQSRGVVFSFLHHNISQSYGSPMRDI